MYTLDFGTKGKGRARGEDISFPHPSPLKPSSAFPLSSGCILTSAWHRPVPICLPASSLPVCPSCPQVLESPMCHPAPLHMVFPLSRVPFHRFTWLSPCHLSSLSPGIISSQQPAVLPGWDRAPRDAPGPHTSLRFSVPLPLSHPSSSLTQDDSLF